MDSIRFSALKRPQVALKPSVQRHEQPRPALKSLPQDTVQFGSRTDTPRPSFRPLQPGNNDDRAQLIRIYTGTFADPDTRVLLTQYVQEHPSIADAPELYLEALQQLAEHEHRLPMDRALERYEQQLSRVRAAQENPIAPMNQPFPTRQERARQRRHNTPQDNHQGNNHSPERPIR